MGLTIRSENYSADFGCAGFKHLRTKVAELTGKEIFKHYNYLNKGIFLMGDDRIQFFKEYNAKISELADEYNIPHGILNFLYASDIEAEINVEDCKQIYEVIKDYDDNIRYGYSGRSDCAMFSDFKKIIKDCIDNNTDMEWY